MALRFALGTAAALLTQLAVARPLPPILDLDNDGLADQLVADSVTHEVRVTSGIGITPVVTLRTFTGSQTGELFGQGTLLVPDWTGNGVAELIVAAPGFVVSGQSVGAAYLFDAATGTQRWRTISLESRRFTSTLASVPDQNRDGIADVLVSLAPAAGSGARSALLSGKTGVFLAERRGSVASLSAYALAGGALYLLSDFDDSGTVDQDDLLTMISLYSAHDSRADVNGDGAVNAEDMALFLDDFFRSESTVVSLGTAPPEPVAPSPVAPLAQPQPACPCDVQPQSNCGTLTVSCPPPGAAVAGVPLQITASGSIPDGEYCFQVLSGPAELISFSEGVANIRPTGPGAICVRATYTAADPSGNGQTCRLCETCCFNVGDGESPCDDVADVEFVNCPPAAFWFAPSATYELIAHGVPAGGVYRWEIVDDHDSIIRGSFSRNDRFGFYLTPNNILIETEAIVRVSYTFGCAEDFAYCTIRMGRDSDHDGVSDAVEDAGCTDKFVPDTDGDNYNDGFEVASGTNPCDNTSFPDLSRDTDRDGLSDYQEIELYHTNPRLFDTDGDGISDFGEVELRERGVLINNQGPHLCDPLNPWSLGGGQFDGWMPDYYQRFDRDRDGVYDPFEETVGLDPTNPDTDGDGLTDGLEYRHSGLDPFLPDIGPKAGYPAADANGDGISDWDAHTLGFGSSMDADYDGDGLSDGWELLHGFDPYRPDENGDSVDDGSEDSDGDGLSNSDEESRNGDPHNADTDGDGASDYQEFIQNSYLDDASDGGLPSIDTEATVMVQLTIHRADTRWAVRIGRFSFRSTPAGNTDVVANFPLPRGATYPIQLTSLGNSPIRARFPNQFVRWISVVTDAALFEPLFSLRGAQPPPATRAVIYAPTVEVYDLRHWQPEMIAEGRARLRNVNFDAVQPNWRVGGAICDGASYCYVRLNPPIPPYEGGDLFRLQVVEPPVLEQALLRPLPSAGGLHEFQPSSYGSELPPIPQSQGAYTSWQESGYVNELALFSGTRGGIYLPPCQYLDRSISENVSSFGTPMLPNSEESSIEFRLVNSAASSNQPVAKVAFKLRRPPIVLCHGIMSSRSTWNEFVWSEVPSAMFHTRLYKVNYHDTSLMGYSENYRYLIETIKFAINDYREGVDQYITPYPHQLPLRSFNNTRYAATRVNFVGHSQGGQLARFYTADASAVGNFVAREPAFPDIDCRRSNDAAANNRRYLRADNYGLGDFNNVLTIGSPFRGSPLANQMRDLCDPGNQAGQIIFALDSFREHAGSYFGQFIAGDGAFVPPSCASDLAEGSIMQQLLEDPRTMFPSDRAKIVWHSVTGSAIQPFSVTGFAAGTVGAMVFGVVAASHLVSFGDLISGGMIAGSLANGDLIVPILSQRNSRGGDYNSGPGAGSLFTNHAHIETPLFISETGSELIARRVAELFSRTRDSFSHGVFAR